MRSVDGTHHGALGSLATARRSAQRAELVHDAVAQCERGGLGPRLMGTAIVSTALSLDGQETLSRVMLVIAAIWVTLALSFWGIGIARIDANPERV